jgi:hypothetical protein
MVEGALGRGPHDPAGRFIVGPPVPHDREKPFQSKLLSACLPRRYMQFCIFLLSLCHSQYLARRLAIRKAHRRNALPARNNARHGTSCGAIGLLAFFCCRFRNRTPVFQRVSRGSRPACFARFAISRAGISRTWSGTRRTSRCRGRTWIVSACLKVRASWHT